MFGRPVTVFKIFGFAIKTDLSWVILAMLITWSLARGWFPELYKNLPAFAYWWMGLAGALGLFLSIVAHELTHSIVARLYGVTIKSITLFIFGGVAQMEEDPPSWAAEFWMAVAGPVSSAVISGLMLLTRWLGHVFEWPVTVVGVLTYLAWLNLVLAFFNLAPAFPLDGGRILRSILWRWKKNLPWATLIAAKIGTGFGCILIGLGIFSLINGSFVGWLWWTMIGFFVCLAARESRRKTLAHDILQHIRIRDVMDKAPVVLSRSMSLEEFVYEYVYREHFNVYPVASLGKFVGCVTVAGASRVPRDEWAGHTVGSVMEPCSHKTTISPDESADKALAVMNKTGNQRLLVVENDQLVGIIVRDEMLKFLDPKVETKRFETRGEG